MNRFVVIGALALSMLSTTSFAHHSHFKGMFDTDVSSSHCWTGYYAGVSLGAVQQTTNIIDYTDVDSSLYNATEMEAHSFAPGVQIGYRKQMGCNAAAAGVFGAELSFNGASASVTKHWEYSDETHHSKLKNYTLLEGTAGIAANRTLLFISAGVGSANFSARIEDEFSHLGGRHTGVVGGVGAEYAINDRTSVRVKLDEMVFHSHDRRPDSHRDEGVAVVNHKLYSATVGLNVKIG